ncbi:Hypothetical predicted protein [Paramuricea clavata]|uniref:Uncharacterized protein n=1 Tax=Paramuricea clavata TaxID=317549 RepID=A0A7D9EP44_PARCT|nr:Hypothetical predicted protein [Paramuricea clavata]
MSIVEVNVANHEVEGQALNQVQENEENNCQNDIVTKLRSLVYSDFIDIILKVLFVLLSIPWLISVIFFSIFDTKCIVFEQASVINCSQNFFISNPRRWVSAWLFMSIISSLLLILIIRMNHKKLNYQRKKAKKIYKKGSFFSLIFLLVVSSVYYIVRIFGMRSETTSLFISILVFLWPPVTVLLVCCLNYLPRVRWQKIDLPHYSLVWCKRCLNNNSNFIIYWLALSIYLVEITCKLTAIMLDVAHDVAPLIQNRFPDESGKYWGGMVIVIGFRMAFHARLLSFFWQKLFHGEKDLFSEPSAKLVDEPLSQDEVEAQPGENVRLEEIIFS